MERDGGRGKRGILSDVQGTVDGGFQNKDTSGGVTQRVRHHFCRTWIDSLFSQDSSSD